MREGGSPDLCTAHKIPKLLALLEHLGESTVLSSGWKLYLLHA